MDVVAGVLRARKEDFVRRCVKTYHDEEPGGQVTLEPLFDFLVEGVLRTIEGREAQSMDPILESLATKVACKEMRPSQGIRVINVLRDAVLDFARQENDGASMAEIVCWMDRHLGGVTEQMMRRIESTHSLWKDEIEKREKQIEELERKTIKLTSKKSRGWVDVGGTRMCLFDIPGGWSNMRTTINLFAGEETYRRVMFEMGLSENFSKKATQEGVLGRSPQGMLDAMDTFSEAGFGDFAIIELSVPDGYAKISCKDSFEGWSFLDSRKGIDSPACYYSAGVLLSFMQSITGRTDLFCIETTCIAKGDELCEFIIGTREKLEQRGLHPTSWGMTIKERAEYLESLLEEKSRMEKELTRKYRELSALHRISARVNQSLNLEEILNFAVNELHHIVGKTKGVGIYLLDRQHNELVFTAQKGYSEDFFKRVSRLKIDEGLVGSVVRAKAPLAYDDYPSYPKALQPAIERAEVKSAMSVPLMAKDRIVGALSIASKTRYHFTPEEVNLMTLIGNQIGVAIENAQLLEEIKESERKYKTLVEDINDGYVVCQDDRVTFANQAFCDMYGYKQVEVLGCDIQQFFLNEITQPREGTSHHNKEAKSVPGHVEFLRRHREGTELPTELKINFVKLDGKPAVIGIVRDISERKRMEQKVRENERLASIGQMAAAIAHEIRNPLSAVKMNVQLLSRNLNLQGFDKRRLEIAGDEIKRLERIVEDVLDFARPVQMRMAPGNINDLITRCVDLLGDIAVGKNVRIERKLARKLGKLPLDSEKVEQAFLNIVINALDAMPNGGTLEIVTGNAHYGSRNMVLAEFKDQGIGLTNPQRAKIFEPFYTTKTTGVGLGLPNAKKIIEAHGGVIEVESKMSQGTSFRVFLPSE